MIDKCSVRAPGERIGDNGLLVIFIIIVRVPRETLLVEGDDDLCAADVGLSRRN